MKKFVIKSLFFVVLFAFVRIYPNIWCDDFIFFRFWEREGIDQASPLLPRFCPNVNIKIIEEGDQNHGLDCSQKKHIHWFTDKYGFRNTNNITNADYLFVGCSNVLGSNCDYSYTFSGILNTEYNTYQIAPDYTLNFFQSLFNREKPQKIKHLFLVQVARYFSHENQFKLINIPFDSSIGLDHMRIQRIKGNYFGNKMKSFVSNKSKICKELYHYYGTAPEIKFLGSNVKTLKERLSFFKIPTTIIVIPDKEFYRKNDTLNKIVYQKIIEELQLKKLPFVRLDSLFSEQCYFHGDGHINETGHAIISNIIRDIIISTKPVHAHHDSQ